MDFAPTAEQRDLARNVDAMLAALGGVDTARTAFESDPAAADPLWRSLTVEMGLIGLAVSEEAGELGYLPIELCLLHERLGQHLAPVPFTSTLLAARALSLCAHDPVRDDLLARALDGQVRLVEFLSTDVRGQLTIGRDADDRVIVSGTIDGVSNAHTIDGIICFAEVDGRPRLLHIATTPGSHTPQPTALDLTRLTGAVLLEAAVAHELTPVESVEALGSHLRTLAQLLTAAEQLGVASASIESGAAWAREREQFGRPIGSFQAIKHRLVNAYNEKESAWTLVYLAAWAATQGDDDLDAQVDEALLAANDAATQSAGAALQVHGGIGFTWEHRSHLYLRRARANALTHTTRSRQLERIAARILEQEK